MAINMKEVIAKMKAKAEKERIEKEERERSIVGSTTHVPPVNLDPISGTGMHGEVIIYNQNQQAFIDTVISGASCVLNGAAGTGKTTCTQGAIRGLIDTGIIPSLKADGHKHLKDGSPGIAIISFTRRAVNNIRKVQSDDLKHCCITAHKLLEYAPEFYEEEDINTGLTKKTMRFLPSRNEHNPLPDTLKTIGVSLHGHTEVRSMPLVSIKLSA